MNKGNDISVLGIFAHPDDESFGPGGTLAHYAELGADVHVIIATDGIAGSVEDPSHLQTHESLAQVRSTELSNAAVALQVTSIWSLPYRDSGMINTKDNEHPESLIQQPVEQITTELFQYVQRLRPDVIITHDLFGGYGHPDHIHVCKATTAAFHLARLEANKDALSPSRWMGPKKLYYTAFDKRLLKAITRIMPLLGQDPRAIGRNKDIDLVEISTWETPIHARIDISSALPRKLAASQAHTSQYSGGPGFYRFLPPPVRQRLMNTESFTLAYPEPSNGSVETDLFAGLL
jgi:mycothiol S-conjugate amidase